MTDYFIGIDVGTGSARAGVFDRQGRLLAAAKRPITLWHEQGSVVEQSGDEIWQAICVSVQEAVMTAKILPGEIAGIGFDATCSLVAVKADGTPVAVGPSNDANRNIMVWMDHRAAGEAAEINEAHHPVLNYVGGRISPEMETPKLLWLKRNRPEAFAEADHFFDLADYLTWRATGSLARSVCTVTCKWTYLAHEKRWDESYLRSIGLGELADEGFRRIGTEIADAGEPLASGLLPAAAQELGLEPGIAVGAALIDAHAGGVGTLAGESGGSTDIKGRLAYIFGTSACSMASSESAVFVDGVWGPYFSAMVPGLWLTEGGQSAAGAAIDHLVTLHPALEKARTAAATASLPLVPWLEREAQRLSPDLTGAVLLAGGKHVVPEFLGNRSPLADPDSRAVIGGLGLETDLDDLVSLYVAGLCGIGYGLRQLLDALTDKGIAISLIVASGGAAQSPLVRQVLADATGVPVASGDTPEPVLLGAAMLGARASGRFSSLTEAMSAMSQPASTSEPAGGEIAALHAKRYEAFKILQSADRAVRQVMAS